MPPGSPYSLNAALAEFFRKTSVTRSTCDAVAAYLVGGTVIPVAIQGNCSYTVYAGRNSKFVLQFRPKPFSLPLDTIQLARKIHGQSVPKVSCYGVLGSNTDNPLVIYAMVRVEGRSYLDFILENNLNNENSHSNIAYRKVLIGNIASFFARSWKSPQKLNAAMWKDLQKAYSSDLQKLHSALPIRFQPTVQMCLDSIHEVFSLPAALLHQDFSTANLIVTHSCELVGVLDWGEARICPFGLNLHFLQNLFCALDLDRGWRPYVDHRALHDRFWMSFVGEVRGTDMSLSRIKIIKIASVMGLLLYRGFTRRLAGMPDPVPVSDDEAGRYSLMFLDSFLINPSTRIDVEQLANTG